MFPFTSQEKSLAQRFNYFHESAAFWKVNLSYIREGGPFGIVLLSRKSRTFFDPPLIS